MSRVTCHNFFWGGGQSGEASRWRVCYQRGLPCLVFRFFEVVFSCMFFQNLFFFKLPHRYPKQGGGLRPLLDNVQKEAAFFQDYFPKSALDFRLQKVRLVELAGDF